MTYYDLWTLTPWHELDDPIVRNIETFEDAREQAQDEANDRDRPVQILLNGNGSYYDPIYPEAESA